MTWRSALLLLILILFPALSSWSAWRHLEALKQDLKRQRISFYLVSVIVQWALTLIALFVVWTDGGGLADIGFRLYGAIDTAVFVGLGVTVVLGLVMLLILRLQQKRRWSETDILTALLPETPREKTVFVGLSATAGFCEETLYRGFAITRFALLTGGIWSAAALAVIIFALGHGYQGPIGVFRAGMLGAVLAVTFIATGSLIPGMIAHFLYDALAGFWGRRWLEENQSDTRHPTSDISP